MDDTGFITLTASALEKIEQAFDRAGIDIESPADGIIEIEFEDGSKMVINRHTAAQEIWVAARSGGFHFRHDGRDWRDTRDNSELFAKLSALAAQQGNVMIAFDD